jgi:NAD(P)-dependent dehydrogenase (short-subunit alcohol dehydrogenase family)
MIVSGARVTTCRVGSGDAKSCRDRHRRLERDRPRHHAAQLLGGGGELVGAAGRDGQRVPLLAEPGVGVGAAAAEHLTKRIDLQLAVNLRAIVLFYREALGLLRAAGAEHRNALVVNTSSISGKSGRPWLSVYSATKAGVIGCTQAMNKELNGEGIKSVALAPGSSRRR